MFQFPEHREPTLSRGPGLDPFARSAEVRRLPGVKIKRKSSTRRESFQSLAPISPDAKHLILSILSIHSHEY
jgi:hypothetical protein